MLKAVSATLKSLVTLSTLINSVIAHFATDFDRYSKATKEAKDELNKVLNTTKVDEILSRMQDAEDLDVNAQTKKLITDKLNAMLIEELNK